MLLVAGEALVDLVPEPGGATLAAHLGGGPANAARAAARLRAPVAFLGAVSRDVFGTRLASALQRDGVDLRFVVRTDAPTTLAVASVRDGEASYAFYLDGTSAAQLTLADVPAESLEGVGALAVGSLALIAEPISRSLLDLVRRAAGSVPVVVDPNMRPAAVADHDAYRSRVGEFIAHATLVKASADDLEFLLPGEGWLQVATEMLGSGPSVVLVTRGSAGATALTKHGRIDVAAPRAAVVDSIGAGDVFLGALLAWAHGHGALAALADLATLREGVRYAVHAATWTCARAGAVAPRPGDLADV